MGRQRPWPTRGLRPFSRHRKVIRTVYRHPLTARDTHAPLTSALEKHTSHHDKTKTIATHCLWGQGWTGSQPPQRCRLISSWESFSADSFSSSVKLSFTFSNVGSWQRTQSTIRCPGVRSQTREQITDTWADHRHVSRSQTCEHITCEQCEQITDMWADHKHVSRSQTCEQITNMWADHRYVSKSQTCEQITNMWADHKHVSRSQTCEQITNTWADHKHMSRSQAHEQITNTWADHKHVSRSQTREQITDMWADHRHVSRSQTCEQITDMWADHKHVSRSQTMSCEQITKQLYFWFSSIDVQPQELQ